MNINLTTLRSLQILKPQKKDINTLETIGKIERNKIGLTPQTYSEEIKFMTLIQLL